MRALTQRVVWQGDAFEDEEHRYVVKKTDLLSSKLFRALFGGAHAAVRRTMRLEGD